MTNPVAPDRFLTAGTLWRHNVSWARPPAFGHVDEFSSVTSCGQVRWDDVRCLRMEHANRLSGSCCGALRGDVRCCRRGRTFRGAEESVSAATGCGWVTLRRSVRTFG